MKVRTDGNGNTQLDEKTLPIPTKVRRGTSAKISLMAERRAMGQSIFHPKDVGMPERGDFPTSTGDRMNTKDSRHTSRRIHKWTQE